MIKTLLIVLPKLLLYIANWIDAREKQSIGKDRERLRQLEASNERLQEALRAKRAALDEFDRLHDDEGDSPGS